MKREDGGDMRDGTQTPSTIEAGGTRSGFLLSNRAISLAVSGLLVGIHSAD